jgi:AbrB family looped-hinge helix DNA binding protein
MIRGSSKGQIVLPKSFREKAGIVEGDFIFVEEMDGILLIEKPVPSKLSELTKNLRKEAADRNFTRQDLEHAIRETREPRKTALP